MNEITPYLQRCVEDRIINLRDSILRKARELLLLEQVLAGKYPEAHLTTEHDNDTPVVLFPGDRVITKYGDEGTIVSFEAGMGGDEYEWYINFKEIDKLPNHRISSVEARAKPLPTPYFLPHPTMVTPKGRAYPKVGSKWSFDHTYYRKFVSEVLGFFVQEHPYGPRTFLVWEKYNIDHPDTRFAPTVVGLKSFFKMVDKHHPFRHQLKEVK